MEGQLYKSFDSRLRIALVIAGVVLVTELAGGALSNSLALLSDAFHVLADILAITLSIFALNMAKRPHTSSLSYGYHRTEILASFINGVMLVGVALFIFLEAYRRITNPSEVQGILLLIFATLGLAGNIAMVLILRGYSRENLNIKGAYLHMWSDAVSSIGVIIGGIIIHFTRFFLIDALIGVFIGVIILMNAFHLLKESGMILMERVPSGLDPANIVQEIMKNKAVKGIHDLHIWTLTSGFHVLSGHIVVDDQRISEAEDILAGIDNVLKESFGVNHTTIQLESESMNLVEMKRSREE